MLLVHDWSPPGPQQDERLCHVRSHAQTLQQSDNVPQLLCLTSLCVSWLSGSSKAWMEEWPPAWRVVASSEDSTVLVPAEGPAGQTAHAWLC